MSAPLITIFVRHAADCPHAGDEFSKRCKCRKHFRWSMNGKQYRQTAKARTWAEAETNRHTLEDQLAGKEPEIEDTRVTVAGAVADWLKMREQGGLGNEKATTLTELLTAWCTKQGIMFVTEITPAKALAFRMSLPYRSGDSSSLKIHWSVITGFFRWCTGMGYYERCPVPSARENPQFAIKFNKREVVPPTKAQVEAVLNAASGKIKLLAQLMRWSGMAINDAMITKPKGAVYSGERKKTGEKFRVRIPGWLADQLKGVSFTENLTWASPVHYWEHQYRLVFKAAKVKMKPHHFRHYRITELVSSGVPVDDVALMVGTSPAEIRKTYHHWIKETTDRLDEQQSQEFIKQGLDEKGNRAIQ